MLMSVSIHVDSRTPRGVMSTGTFTNLPPSTQEPSRLTGMLRRRCMQTIIVRTNSCLTRE